MASSSEKPIPYVQAPRPQRILIIGGGAAGLASLNALISTDAHAPFTQVELIERRQDIGGVWYLDQDTVQWETSLPAGTANGQWPIRASSSSRPLWPSPAYPALRGNVLPRFLSFSGIPPFPKPSDDPFPTLAETHDYLQRVATPIQKHIRTGIECVGVWELPVSKDLNRWAVRLRDWNENGVERTEYWDAVVMAVGWTDNPSYPPVPGLDEAKRAGFVEHAKWYRGPQPYQPHERIVVVGNGNSGNDICAQVAQRRLLDKHEPVYRVVRHKAHFFYVSLASPLIRDVPGLQKLEVLKKDGKESLVAFLDDGSRLDAVDKVIFAIGYETAKFPYLHVLNRGTTSRETALLPIGEDRSWDPRETELRNTSLWRTASDPEHGTSFDVGPTCSNPARVSGLVWHLVHSRASTLAFTNLVVSSVPFALSDMQGHLLRTLWEGTLRLPQDLHSRLESERQRIDFVRQSYSDLPEDERKKTQAWRERLHTLQRETPGSLVATHARQPLPVLNSFEPPEFSGVSGFHVIGPNVQPYLTTLRDTIVQSKPEWQDRLPYFDDLVMQEHDGMYQLKYQTLQSRQEAQRKTLGPVPPDAQQNLHYRL